jgi:hypothetical protein
VASGALEWGDVCKWCPEWGVSLFCIDLDGGNMALAARDGHGIRTDGNNDKAKDPGTTNPHNIDTKCKQGEEQKEPTRARSAAGIGRTLLGQPSPKAWYP